MRTPILILVLISSVLGFTSVADAASLVDHRPFERLQPVSNSRLHQLRGGFTISIGGVSVSVGGEQATYINGHLVASLDLTGMPLPPQALRVIQNGSKNVFNPASVEVPADTIATVIQNSLDKQLIQNINVMNVTITSQALARAQALESTLRSSILSRLGM